MCYNLLEYIVRARGAAAGTPEEPAVTAVYDKAAEDWRRFQEDPYVFVPGT